jgi:opacity protein-like surface antigen
MKRILVSILLVGACASTGSAQVSLGWGVQGDAANVSVGGVLKDAYGWGYGGGLHLDVNLALIDLRFSGDYVSASLNNEEYRAKLQDLIGNQASSYSVEGGNVSVLSVNANLKWTVLPLPVLSPYLTGGVGLARTNTGSLTVKYLGTPVSNFPEVESETKTIYNLGAGADLSLGGITLYVEAKYCRIMTEGEQTTYVPISVGITF